MELYKRFPILCTVWAFLEVVCFGGAIFGWASLVFILKEEGFYIDACSRGDQTNDNTNGFVLNSSVTFINNGDTNVSKHYAVLAAKLESVSANTALNDSMAADDSQNVRGCQAQEARLNLWFSIAVSFMYLSFTGIGYLIKNIGTRYTRLIFLIIYLIGTLCLAFAKPEIPWLLLPGLSCMGTAGLVLLATNLQVANLHPHLRSTIVAIFTGLFDFSTVTKQLIKVAYENGIARKTSYIFISIAFGIIVTISTLCLLPKTSISEEHVEEIKRRRSSVRAEHLKKRNSSASGPNNNENQTSLLKTSDKKPDDINGDVTAIPVPLKPRRTLCATLLSVTCILHLYWLFVHALRFVTFIGLLNVWLENIVAGDEMKVSELLGVFSYMTMGAIGTALMCGFIYDWQRKRYIDAGEVKRVYVPVVLPMCLVIFYSICTTVLCYIRHTLAPYFAFAVFTFFRSSLFTVGVAFVGDAFPMDYFGVLFGFIQLSAGIAGLIQYPIFEWFDAYEGSYVHVNILMLALQISTFVHPILLWIKGHRDVSQNNHHVGTKDLVVKEESTAA